FCPIRCCFRCLDNHPRNYFPLLWRSATGPDPAPRAGTRDYFASDHTASSVRSTACEYPEPQSAHHRRGRRHPAAHTTTATATATSTATATATATTTATATAAARPRWLTAGPTRCRPGTLLLRPAAGGDPLRIQ